MKIIPKLQQGGWIYSVYQAPQGASYTPPSSKTTTTKSSKSDSGELTEKDFMKMLKDMDGLPYEMQEFASNLSNLFQWTSLTGDTTDLADLYISQLSKLRTLKFNKEQYDEAYKEVKSQHALDEYAITPDGQVMVQDQEGNVLEVPVKEYLQNKDALHSVTNSNLLWMRAHTPFVGSGAYGNRCYQILDSAVSYQSIMDALDKAKIQLGQVKQEQSGFDMTDKAAQGMIDWEHASEEDKVRLAADIADKKVIGKEASHSVSSNLSNILSYANFLAGALSPNMKAWIQLRSGNPDMQEAVEDFIKAYLAGRLSTSESWKWTDKKEEKSGGSGSGSGGSGSDKTVRNSGSILVNRQGTFEWTNLNLGGTGTERVMAWSGTVTDKYDNNMPHYYTLNDLAEGITARQLDMDHASMYGIEIDPTELQGVLITGNKYHECHLLVNPDNPNVPDLDKDRIDATTYVMDKLEKLGAGVSADERYAKAQEYTKEANDTYHTDIPVPILPDGTYDNTYYRRFLWLNGVADTNKVGERLRKAILDHRIPTEKVGDEEIQKELAAALKDEHFRTGGWYNFWSGLTNSTNQMIRGSVFIPIERNMAETLGRSYMTDDNTNAAAAMHMVEQNRDNDNYQTFTFDQ